MLSVYLHSYAHEQIIILSLDCSIVNYAVLFTGPAAVGTVECIEVEALSDNMFDPGESFTVTISSTVSRVIITRNTTTVVIIDDGRSN